MAEEIHIQDTTEFRCTVLQNSRPIDLQGASTLQLIFKKPDATTMTRSATLVREASNRGLLSILRYVATGAELNLAGEWQVQGYIEIGSGQWHTDTKRFTVFDNLT